MNINVHPLLVHFPLGLLTIYALLELVRWKQLNGPTLFAIKAFLLITGFAAACATWLSGQLAEGTAIVKTLAHPELVGIHSTLAEITIVIFAVLALGYAVVVLEKLQWGFAEPITRILGGFGRIITETLAGPIIALIGLVLLLVTGGLGGVVVYGEHLDPFTRVLYQAFKGFAETGN